MNPVMLKVLFDPLSYVDPGRVSARVAPDGALRAALNRALIGQYALPDADLAALTTDEYWVLDAWFGLRRAAYLLGCRRLRAQVLQQIGFLRCDAGVRRFLTLPLPCAEVQAPGVALSENVLLRYGAELFEPLFSRLAPALRARAALLFPEDVSAVLSADSERPLHRSLLQLAIHHAQTA
jgi:type III secretion system OrgA/MxiK family protein